MGFVKLDSAVSTREKVIEHFRVDDFVTDHGNYIVTTFFSTLVRLGAA